jgi:hypothetical protein
MRPSIAFSHGAHALSGRRRGKGVEHVRVVRWNARAAALPVASAPIASPKGFAVMRTVCAQNRMSIKTTLCRGGRACGSASPTAWPRGPFYIPRRKPLCCGINNHRAGRTDGQGYVKRFLTVARSGRAGGGVPSNEAASPHSCVGKSARAFRSGRGLRHRC